jgi:hypothetical protein
VPSVVTVWRSRSEHGQASAELVAIVPLLVAGALALGQALVAGWALLAAGESARVGARVAHTGGNAEQAALQTLPDPLEDAQVEVDGSVVKVRVLAPTVLPGVPGVPIRASAALDPESSGG